MLEELINEVDRPIFATPQCGNFMGSSEGPIFFLAAYASPLFRWNCRTVAMEEENLPLLQGVTPSGYACDLGLSAYADDVAKKWLAGARRNSLRRWSSLWTTISVKKKHWFATTLIARKHAAAAMLCGHCRVDAGAFPWPISTPLSLQCRLCDDGDNYTSVDEFYDHAVAVHLPKPSPVSLPIATALHHACDTRGTRRNTSDERRDHGRGGEERTTDTSEIGGWRTWFGTTERGRRSKRTGERGRSRGLQKEARRLLQEHHAVDGHHHQEVPAMIASFIAGVSSGTSSIAGHAGADASVQRERTDS